MNGSRCSCSGQEIESYLHEITEGKGYVCVPAAIDPSLLATARRLLLAQAHLVRKMTSGQFPTSWPTADYSLDYYGHPPWAWLGELGPFHRRVRQLFHIDAVFDQLATIPIVMQLCKRLLAPDFILGAYTGNILFGGCPAGSMHRDYPYWSHILGEDINNMPLPDILEIQMILPLDPFTLENGATAMIPGSHKWTYKDARTPTQEEFWEQADRITCDVGSVIIGQGSVLHASGPNQSENVRVGLLAQYLKGGTKRMISQLDEMKQVDFVWRRASSQLRSLLRPPPPVYKIPNNTTHVIKLDSSRNY
jgi:hypothetical protein